MTVKSAIKEFLENTRDAKLLRKLFMSNRWIVPIPDEETGKIIGEGVYPDFFTIRDDAGKMFMDIFSDDETFEKYRDKYPEACDFTLRVDGWWLFQIFKTMSELEYVNIDTENDNAIQYKKEEFDELAEYAASYEIAETLRQVRYQGDLSRLHKLKSYQDYQLLIDHSTSSTDTYIVLSPDKRGRKLVSVFTSREFAEQASGIIPKAKDLERIVVKYDGLTLFENLNKLELDGMVFNVATELEPIAFQMQLCGTVLNT